MDKERLSSSVQIIHGYSDRGLTDGQLGEILNHEYAASRVMEKIHLELTARRSKRGSDSERLARVTGMLGTIVKSLLDSAQIICQEKVIMDVPCFDFESDDFAAAANRIAAHLGELGYQASVSHFKVNVDAQIKPPLPDTIFRLEAEAKPKTGEQ